MAATVAAQTHSWKPFELAIKLLLLTGQRRNEMFDADRRKLDLAAKLWTISGDWQSFDKLASSDTDKLPRLSLTHR